MNRCDHPAARRLAAGFLLVVGFASGCTEKGVAEAPARDDPPALRAIRARYEQLVERARHDPDVNWHTGWLGNLLVNQVGGDNRGLCYQWQDYLYSGVEPTVERVGWRATGVAVNEDREHEHHCVMVWDPRLVDETRILPDAGGKPVYVLDVWRTNRAAIFRLDDWLEGEKPHENPARVQRLPEEMTPLPSPGRWEGPRPNAGPG